MGAGRKRPARLAEKLKAVREKLGYNMPEMADMLSDDEVYIYKQDIHRYETGLADPNYIIMLRYCELSNIDFKYFANDKLNLPR